MNILIADDKEENRYFLEALLGGSGHRTRSVADGVQALEALRAEPFDLIISDILMPVMDGFQLCRNVRADKTLRHIPFIIYTATYTGPQDEVFAKTIGANHFIIKPCEPDVFMEAVESVMLAAQEDSNVGKPETLDEEEILKLYSERLVRKLELKMTEAEQELAARRETEVALRESEEKHRLLFETIPQGVVYQDREWKIISANPAAERILGLTLSQMQGRTSVDPRWKTIQEDGSDFPGTAHPSVVALRTGQIVKDVIMGVYNPREDIRRWLKIDAVPLFKPGEDKPYQVYTTFDDITERKRIENALIEKGLFLGTLLDAIPLPVFYKDTQGRYVGYNKAFRDFFAKEDEDLVGKTVFDVMDKEFAGIQDEKDKELLSTPGVQVYEVRIPNGRGHLQDVIFHKATYVDSTGHVAGLVGVILDITERKRTEEQLSEQLNELRRWHMATLGRETRILDLKTEINALHQLLGRPPRYTSVEGENIIPRETDGNKHPTKGRT